MDGFSCFQVLLRLFMITDKNSSEIKYDLHFKETSTITKMHTHKNLQIIRYFLYFLQMVMNVM